MGLAAQGSQGATFDQIKSTLHMTGNQEAIADQFGASQLELAKNTGKVTLNVANKVYVKNNYELKPAFKEVAEKKFNSEGESVDFADSVPTAAKINGWVETKTNSKIKDLIKPDSLDTDTRLVLVNAIYFKGNWRNQFKEENTYKDKFWTSEDKSIDVDMMHIKADFKFGTFEDLDATALEMPYNDSDISFLVLLPNKRTGLKDLEAKLKTINLADLTSNMYKSEVEVSLPKFRSEYEIELTEPLKEVCMTFTSLCRPDPDSTEFTNIFNIHHIPPPRKFNWLIEICHRFQLGLKKIFEDADFSNMLTSPEPLQVSSIVHKAFIEVNEQGAEAAAATGMFDSMSIACLCRFYLDTGWFGTNFCVENVVLGEKLHVNTIPVTLKFSILYTLNDLFILTSNSFKFFSSTHSAAAITINPLFLSRQYSCIGA